MLNSRFYVMHVILGLEIHVLFLGDPTPRTDDLSEKPSRPGDTDM